MWARVVMAAIAIAALCQSEQVKVLQFGTKPTSSDGAEERYAVLEAKPSKIPSSGFTICLRANIIAWTSMQLFEINIGDQVFESWITSFESKYGFLYFNNTYIGRFYWGDSILFSPYAWNAICAALDEVKHYLLITVNAQKVFGETNNDLKLNSSNYSSSVWSVKSTIYSTNITDLNVWNRPLTMNEITQLYTDCNLNFLKQIRPEYIYWPDANMKLVRTGIYSTTEDFYSICERSDRRYSEIFLIPKYNSFDSAKTFCYNLNADFPRISNLNDFEQLFNLSQNKNVNLCQDVWVPVRRSINESSRWYQETQHGNNSEVSVNDAQLKNIKQLNPFIYFSTPKNYFSITTDDDM